MSYRSNVDEQVVKMSFDNSNFDSNVNDSIKTLNSLDSKLASLNNANFSGLNSGMESLSNFLTVKGQVMFGILTRLGNEVVNFGIKAKNALFGGIRDGLGEYNTIINSTQTIFQNVRQSGATIKDVNAALDELNDYADLTIYNFGQMTNMIGKFTAAGVGLKKSVSTIKGLANAAALVGATPEKAEQAWQAVSRAMARGTFNLRTWYSLQTSSIASEQFVKVIKDVARANNALGKSGQNIDEMLEKYGSLEYTLSENWLTSDLFNEAMSILSGDLKREQLEQKGYTEEQINELLDIAEAAEEAATQIKTFRQLMDTLAEAMGSGWAQSFRILIGDLDQAKVLYTRISNVISELVDNSARIRNELFKQIMGDSKKEKTGIFAGLTTGRDSFKQTIENMMATVKTFLKAVKTGFLNIFPIERIATAARKAMDVIQQFTRAFVLNSEEAKQKVEGITGWDTSTIDKISESVKDLIRFFRGLASVIDIVWMVISQPIKAIIKRVPFFNNFFENLGSGIKSITSGLGKFGDKITVFRNALKDTSFLENIVGYFIDNIDELGEKYPVLGAILWVFKALKTTVIGVKDAFKQLNIKPFAVIFGTIKAVITIIWKVLNFIFNILKSISSNIDWSFLEGPKNIVIGFLKKLSDYGQGLISFEELTGKIGEKISKIFSKIISFFDKSNKSNKFTKDSNDSFNKLKDTISKTGNKISDVWEKIKAFFASIGKFFKNIFGNANFSFKDLSKNIALIGGGVAVAALAIGKLRKTISKIHILDNFNNLLVAGINVLKAYEKQIASKAILNIAIAVGILAGAMLILSLVPYDKLENGLVIFTGFMTVISITLPLIINALSKFVNAIGYARESVTQFTVMNTLAKKFGSAAKKLARGLEFRMFGKMFKDIAISILIFVGAFTALIFLFKHEEKNLIKSVNLVKELIITISIAVGSLVLVIELLSKKSKDLSTTVGTFASFFKLSGVARVILAISASVLILAAAMRIMAKIDPERLKTIWAYVMSMLVTFGIISTIVSGITALSENTSKLKKITLSLTGALLGMAVVLMVMKPLIATLNEDVSGSWIKSVIIFTAIIGQFTAMSIALLAVAKTLGGNSIVWEKLNKTLLIMTSSLVVMAGLMYVISLMGDIPTNTIFLIGVLEAGLLGILSLLSIISKSSFSGNFVTIISAIGVSVAALVASIGILAAGIGALIAALSIETKDSDVNKATNTLFNKLTMIADSIKQNLPTLKEAFYSIGTSVGSVVLSFVSGFADSIVSNGETLLSIADKFVNLIIDLLNKITDILYTRKDDIANIIRRLIEFVVAEITAVLNSFFKNKLGKGLFTEEGVAKLLGIGGLAFGGFKLFEGISNKLEKLKKGFEGIKVTFKTIKSGGEKVVNVFKKINGLKSSEKLSDIFDTFGFAEGIKYMNTNLVHAIGNMKIFKGLGSAVEKISGGKLTYDNTSDVGVGETVAAVGAVVVATKAVEVAIHGVNQLLGKELPYIRTDVLKGDDFSSWMASLGTLFTDKMFLMQVAIEGMSTLGEFIVTIIQTILIIITMMVLKIVKPLFKAVQFIGDQVYAYNIGKYEGTKLEDALLKSKAKFDKFFDDVFIEYPDYLSNVVVRDWTNLFTPTAYEEYTGPDKQDKQDKQDKENAYNDGYDISASRAEGEIAGAYDYAHKVRSTMQSIAKSEQEAEKDDWKINSPSKITREIYRNVMQGAIEGIKDKEQDYYSYFKHISDVEIGLAKDSADAIVEAWSDISSAQDFSIDSFNDAFSKMNAEELSLAFKGIGNDIETWSEIVNSMDFSSYAGALKELTGAEVQAAWYNISKALEMSEYIGVLNQLNAEQLADAWAGIAAAEGYDLEIPFRNLEFEMPDEGPTIDLNEPLLNYVINNPDEFIGLTLSEAEKKAADNLGLTASEYINTMEAIFSYVEQGAELTAEAIEQINSDTALSLQEVFGNEVAANEMARNEIMLGYSQVGEAAGYLKDDLIGKKKEEVQAILQEEAEKCGMSTKLAADSSRLITEELFKGVSDRQVLSEQAYNNNIEIYKNQLDSYVKLQDAMTTAEKKFAEIRTKIEATAYHQISEMMQSGEMSADQYQYYMKYQGGLEAQKEYSELLKEWSAAKSGYDLAASNVDDFMKSLVLDRAPLTDYNDYFNSYYDSALSAIKEQEKSSKRKNFLDILSDFTKGLGLEAPELKLGYWDFTDITKDGSTLTDSGISSAVSAASDLKDSLESQRADLTPTFDLDQLAEDAQKANGIVMSSLMAAQNASIGDYINQDSELNPFMKDRWQNVYNFTQNNYSPKALSRIDIYRQTQRQLSMSRGF